MPWFNVDDSFYDHPKVFDAPDCAVALWSRAGSWSSRNLTDGFVPAKMPARLCDDHEAAVRELLDRGLWQRTRGGYLFHDWTDWNLSKEAVERKRANDAERQRRHRQAKAGSNSTVTRDMTRDATRDMTGDSSVSHSAQSNPIQSVVDVVSHLAGSYARDLDDDDLLKVIIDSIHQRTGQVVSADHARSVASGILSAARSRPGNLRAYLQKSILDERDPHGRFLPPRPAPEPIPAAPWCGKCDEKTRLTDEDLPRRCPNCHPLNSEKAS